MSSHNAPSAGQKVHPGGSQAPISSEGVGAVDTDSLAADSLRSDGGFTANANAAPGSGPAGDARASKPGTSGQPGANNPQSLANQESYAGAAPSYYIAPGQTRRDHHPEGPHGRNLTEGGFAGSGTAEGRLAEPGSEQDPAREALRRLNQGQGGGGGGGGGGESGVRRKLGDGEQRYSELDGNTSS